MFIWNEITLTGYMRTHLKCKQYNSIVTNCVKSQTDGYKNDGKL